MYGSMRSDRIPYLHTHAQALNKWMNSVPYKKGKHKGERPLAERRRTALTIRYEEASGGVGSGSGSGDVIIKLYNTDIITYKPDNSIIVKQAGWDTPTTHEVIGRILGAQLFIRHRIGWIACQNGTYPLRQENEMEFRRGSVTDPNSVGTGLHYINPELPTTTKMKRGVYNSLRKQYKGFETFLIGALKLRDGAIPTEDEAEQAVGSRSYEPMMLEDLMDYVNNEEGWYAASVVILRRCKPRGWSWSQSPIKEARVKRELKEMICTHHRDELFYVETVTTGKVVRDSNRKYFTRYMRCRW